MTVWVVINLGVLGFGFCVFLVLIPQILIIVMMEIATDFFFVVGQIREKK